MCLTKEFLSLQAGSSFKKKTKNKKTNSWVLLDGKTAKFCHMLSQRNVSVPLA